MVHRLPVFVMVELQRPLIPFMHQTIAAVRRLLWDIGQQFDRRGQRLAAEADVGDPALPRHFHQQQTVSTRRHLRRVGQHHAAQQAADVKAYLAQRALQQAILFKTIPPAAGGDQLLFQRPIVKVDFTRQQDVEVFKGDGAVMLQMQFPQGINGNIRLTRPAQTGKIGA